MTTALSLRVPAELTTFRQRYSYVETVRERLRRLHNVKGADYRDGKISEEEWERFLAEEFTPKDEAVTRALLSLRRDVKAEARALPDDAAELQAIDLDTCFEPVAATGE